VFDRFRRAVQAQVEQGRTRARPGPPDLAALPAAAAAVGGLSAVPTVVVCEYTGLDVVAVRPLDRLGPESSGQIGGAVRKRLRAAGVGDPSLGPGELVAGQNAARIARMRAHGVPEDQIALVQQQLARATAEHQATGWTIDVAGDHHASVVFHPLGAESSAFDGLQNRYLTQNTQAGIEARERSLWGLGVDQIRGGPFEAYCLPGQLAARGRRHDVEASAPSLGTTELERALAALAFLALYSLEG